MAIRAPRRIIAIALLVMVATGIFGIPVTKSLSAGGFQDPTSESAKAAQLLIDKFGQGDMELILSVTSDGGMESAESRAVGTELVSELQASPHVAGVTSAWTAPPTATPALVSTDGKTASSSRASPAGRPTRRSTPRSSRSGWCTIAMASPSAPAARR